MAGNPYLWSPTAATNSAADADINWVEGQLPSTVNDSARAMMAGVAGWLKDTNATLTTGGSANAQTVTSNVNYAALATGLRLVLKAGFSNTTAACTLTVTPSGGGAFGAKAIKVFTASGESDPGINSIRLNGHYLVEYDTAANAAAGAWILLNPSSPIPGGTVVRTFTASSTYPTATNANVQILAYCKGGGGGGANSSDSRLGGGGGEGGESWKLTTATALSGQTVSIGAGGAGAVPAGNGSAGGTTSIGTVITAVGGAGGTAGHNGGAGGVGGAAGTSDWGFRGDVGHSGGDTTIGTVGLPAPGGGKGGGLSSSAGVANSGGGGGGSVASGAAGGSGIVVCIEYGTI